jgi:hypothetical protein
VWRRQGNKGSFSLIATTAVSPYLNSGLSPATSYTYYYVVASGAAGSTQSNTVTVKTPRR